MECVKWNFSKIIEIHLRTNGHSSFYTAEWGAVCKALCRFDSIDLFAGKEKLDRNFLATQKCGCTSHKKESEQQLQGFVHAQQSGAVAAIAGTIAFLPVDTVLVDAPVAHVCHARVWDRCTASNNLTPATVPCRVKHDYLTMV